MSEEMIGYGGDYPQEASAKIASLGGGRLSRPTVTQRLEESKKHLEFELARVNEALDALKANPEIEKVLNLVNKALR